MAGGGGGGGEGVMKKREFIVFRFPDVGISVHLNHS